MKGELVDVHPHAQSPEPVEVGVEASTTDQVAARSAHLDLARARQQRAHHQNRRSDLLAQLPRDLVHTDVGCSHADRAVFSCDLGPQVGEDVEHGVDVPDFRDVLEHHFLVREEAGGEHRKHGVLVAAGSDLAVQALAAADDESAHRWLMGRDPPEG